MPVTFVLGIYANNGTSQDLLYSVSIVASMFDPYDSGGIGQLRIPYDPGYWLCRVKQSPSKLPCFRAPDIVSLLFSWLFLPVMYVQFLLSLLGLSVGS